MENLALPLPSVSVTWMENYRNKRVTATQEGSLYSLCCSWYSFFKLKHFPWEWTCTKVMSTYKITCEILMYLICTENWWADITALLLPRTFTCVNLCVVLWTCHPTNRAAVAQSGWQLAQQLHWMSEKNGDKRQRCTELRTALIVHLQTREQCLTSKAPYGSQLMTALSLTSQVLGGNNFLLVNLFLLPIKWAAGIKTCCWQNKLANP